MPPLPRAPGSPEGQFSLPPLTFLRICRSMVVLFCSDCTCCSSCAICAHKWRHSAVSSAHDIRGQQGAGALVSPSTGAQLACPQYRACETTRQGWHFYDTALLSRNYLTKAWQDATHPLRLLLVCVLEVAHIRLLPLARLLCRHAVAEQPAQAQAQVRAVCTHTAVTVSYA